MKVSYKKLWMLLIDSRVQIRRYEHDTLALICEILGCDFGRHYGVYTEKRRRRKYRHRGKIRGNQIIIDYTLHGGDPNYERPLS